ncbi:helix-turn-helix domain-containing protein [Nocardia sp. NPDC051463]|uniref:helix-turn-helix domain-containing protein n=1 Tax=Nocardia sp. NPDC051463 TaxID=3154845 RepID=UPI0034185DED
MRCRNRDSRSGPPIDGCCRRPTVPGPIAAIGEEGYQRATVQEICGRAALSAGAMFRHFDSGLDLIVPRRRSSPASLPPSGR